MLAGPLFVPRGSSARHDGAGAGRRTMQADARQKSAGQPPRRPAAAAQPPKLPPRTPFTAADDAAAVIPGMPDARFWANSETDFDKALPTQPGTVAHSLDRRRRRRIRRRLAQRLERRRQPAGLLRRHRGQHRRADGAVCLRRFAKYDAALKDAYTQDHRRPTFSRSARPARASSIPGR